MNTSLFIVGAGFSGLAIAEAARGFAQFRHGTTRSEQKFDALRRAGLVPHRFADGLLDETTRTALGETTHLVVCAAPDEAGDPLLSAHRSLVETAMPALAWIGYLSTVGIYGDHQGAWIDETAIPDPRPGRSTLRLEAENDWLQTGRTLGIPVAILRLSGIYGPGRNALANLAEGKARRIVKPGQVFNRIHVDDIAGATLFLAERRIGGVFNVTDDEPAPPQDVVAYAAALMDVDAPPEIAFEEAGLSPMARSFYGENKRVSNAKLKQAGYAFRHPDYRAALESMWRQDRWR